VLPRLGCQRPSERSAREPSSASVFFQPAPEEKKAEHGTESYQINDWKSCCKLLILRSARVMARNRIDHAQATGLADHLLHAFRFLFELKDPHAEFPGIGGFSAQSEPPGG
jgi:hypothetical protein